MRKLLVSAAIAAAVFVSGAVQAATLRVDVSGLNFNDAGDLYNPSGTFDIDTVTQTVSNINFTSKYFLNLPGRVALIVNDGVSSPGVEISFATNGTFNAFVVNIGGGFNTVMPGIAVGSPQTFSASGFEFPPGGFLSSVDSSVTISRVLPPVPLPAGLPLGLTALAAFGLFKRRKRS